MPRTVENQIQLSSNSIANKQNKLKLNLAVTVEPKDQTNIAAGLEKNAFSQCGVNLCLNN